MKKILFLALLLFFSACATKEVPKWCLKPYNDTKEYIFATGEGKTKTEAINSALRGVISKIEITLSSNVNIQKQLIRTNNTTVAYQNISQIIKTYIPKTRIYSYKIIKIQKNGRYYVLIAVNRIKNANLILEKAKKEIEEIQNSISDDKIYILKTYPKLIKKTDKIISDLYFAYTMFPSPNIKETIQKAVNLKIHLKKQYDSIGFEIKKDYENLLKETLSSLNFPLKNGIKTYIKANLSYQKVMDYYIATINLTVTLKDKTETVFSLVCSGKSISGYQMAKNFAINECKKRLKEKIKNITDSTY